MSNVTMQQFDIDPSYSQPIKLQINLSYDGFTLATNLALPRRGVTVLFGHSGSGKTTCLRVLAGLERSATGRVVVGDSVWQDSERNIFMPTYTREIGYVFQESSLFPHLSVFDNLNYGYKRIGKHKRQIELEDVCELLNITRLLERRPNQLSGGEKQRVSIARALLTSPKLLLMDEPLSALDNLIKAEILPYLEKLHQRLSIPVIYVTHSIDELARLADHVVMFSNGQITRSGKAVDILCDPTFSAQFGERSGAIFDTKVVKKEIDDITLLSIEDGPILYVPKRHEKIGDKVRCRILATDVSVCIDYPKHSSILNILEATVEQIVESHRIGELLLILELASGIKLQSFVTARSIRLLAIKPGTSLWVQIKAVSIC
ncbi:molybdenum ABC transporter ATP-binding protein [Vibrio ulleungensis]|uniref:Molybdenum ABC transporter ATP-binding protein n=1 Tax=Vibrio ulleungensis TaxID=2807619 RepID=A0ABS2HDD6_9VIBR|nr:molybdenum ABC transporter ATP-binding protein [Vibrio ulleungensis]MBM7035598.1 molybdenum ABC transporter ATP-binding protein [Vibrio ulleungensis]